MTIDNKEFRAEYLKELEEKEFEPVKIPWINDDTISDTISVR